MDLQRLLGADTAIALEEAKIANMEAIRNAGGRLPSGNPEEAAQARISAVDLRKIEQRVGEVEGGLRERYLLLLSSLGDEATVEMVIRLFEKTFPETELSEDEQQNACYYMGVLARIGGKRAFDYLQKLRKHPDRFLAMSAKGDAKELFIRGTPYDDSDDDFGTEIPSHLEIQRMSEWYKQYENNLEPVTNPVRTRVLKASSQTEAD